MADDGKVFGMRFGKVWPLLVRKAERKGRTADEVFAVAEWLTGYSRQAIEAMAEGDATYGDFFRNAPRMNPARTQVTGRICGVRVEEIKDPLMRDVRVLDKMVDELAHGKALEKVLRS